ncbi:transcriptional antiterminator, BglG family [Amphibacillus marinus]|uniref:Transcriptional antiterminator, BglG family n=1 Tax=Amphibacillus marinus TaxID=872970 RepID=A0A1H8N9L2_9BACI|nr:PRD domain-containing protein [Amphibacillus marinus]SEO26300.1 transcriptional antiterminator, BglG family [Amphibacillus marinus]
MKLKKALNNNVVLATTDQHEEVVAFGPGISFGLKPGAVIDQNKINKIFTLATKDFSLKLADLLSEIPIEYVEIAEDIIDYARNTLSASISDYAILTLTDHLYFAVTRYQRGEEIRNVLLWEAKKFYREEFKVGLKALELIKDKLNVRFNEDEAGFIAMHIINTQTEGNEIDKTVKITNIVQDILGIIKYHFNLVYDEDSWNYGRLVTHLKFFAQRIVANDHLANNEDDLYPRVQSKYPAAFACAQKIKTYVENGYQKEISESEIVYLVLHIARLTIRNDS